MERKRERKSDEKVKREHVARSAALAEHGNSSSTSSSSQVHLSPNIEAGEVALVQLKREFKDAELVRAEAKEALTSAGDLDAKPASAFEDGISLLQSDVVSYIRKLAMNAYRVSDEDHSTLLCFLFGGDRQ